MNLIRRPLRDENDFWRTRNFLRDVFLLNDRLEHSWHVARLDYWRWHFIMTCHLYDSAEQVTTIWETPDGQIAAVLHPIGGSEIRLHVHPHFRTPELEWDMLAHAEAHLAEQSQPGRRILYVPVFSYDTLRQDALTRRGYRIQPGWGHHWRRDLEASIPDTLVPAGYTLRSMGTIEEHPARCLASWRAFHSDEPQHAYDNDWSWYQNLQSAPLYRRDLDIVAVAADGDIAAFSTIFYDDFTRSAVCVVVGTACGHWQRGLGKAVLLEGMRRLQRLGCTRVFATAHDEPADALYRSVMQANQLTETWVKVLE